MRAMYTLATIVLALSLSSCYEANFSATGSSLKALDAAGLSGAVLDNLPKNPSADVNLDISVKNVDHYIYALVEDGSSCDSASYSKIISSDKKIKDIVGADGTKLLCVRGSSEGYALQLRPTEYRWTKDSIAPGEFALSDLAAIYNTKLDKLNWTEAEGADAGYDIVVSANLDCKQETIVQRKIKDTSLDTSKLEDGTYYICLSAFDRAGNETPASNNRFKITIDTQAPGSFNINRPYAKSNKIRPLLAWSESLGASSYHVILARDSSCKNIVDQQDGVSTLNASVATDLSEGDYYICVEARDDAGNTTLAGNQGYKFNVDFSGVFVSFENTPSDPSKDTRLNVKVVNATYYRYKIVMKKDIALCDIANGYSPDRSTNLPISDDTTKLSDGQRYVVCAYGADDYANWPVNVDKFVNKFEWTIDRTAPTFSFTGPAVCGPELLCKDKLIPLQVSAKDGVNAAAEIQFTISDVNATINTQTIKPSAESFSMNLSLGTAGPGNYTIRGIAKDQAGNTSTVSIKVTYDNSVPNISLIEGDRIKPVSTGYSKDIQNSRINVINMNLTAADSYTNITDVCFKYLRNEDISTVAQDDTCWFGVSPQRTITLQNYPTKVGFIEFRYKIRAWVRDAAGNVSTIRSSNDVYVDYRPVKPPQLTFLYATNSAAVSLPSVSNTTVSPSNAGLYIRWLVTPHVNSDGLLAKPIKLFYSTDGSNYTNAIAANIAADSSVPGCIVSKAPDTAKREMAGCYLWNVPTSLLSSTYISIRVVAEDKDGPISFGQTNNINLTGFRFLAGNTEDGLGATSTASILQPIGSQSLVVHPSGRIFLLDRRGLMTIDPATGVMSVYVGYCGSPTCGSGMYWPQKIALDRDNNLIIREGTRISKVIVAQGPSSKHYIVGGGTRSDLELDNPLDLQMTSTDASHNILVTAPNGDLYFEATKQGTRGSAGAVIRKLSQGKITSLVFGGQRTLWNWPQTRKETIAECLLRGAAFDFNTQGVPEKIFALIEATSDRHRGDNLCGVDVDVMYTMNDLVGYTYNPSNNTTSILDTIIPKSTGYPSSIPGVREFAYSRYYHSLNGNLYARTNGNGTENDKVFRYDSATNSWKHLAGGSYGGECRDTNIDDPQNLRNSFNCALNISSFFIDQQGTVFLVDNDTIRVIDSNNEIITIAGESRSSGDGRNPLSARFTDIRSLDFWKPANGPTKYVVSDVNYRIREFSENTSIEGLIGNGIDRLDLNELNGGPESTLTWGRDAANASFSLEANGDLILHRQQFSAPYRFKRTTMQWESIRKTPSGANVGFPQAAYGPHVLASTGAKVLFGNFIYLGEFAKSGSGALFEFALDGSKDPEFFLGKPLGTRMPFDRLDGLCPEGTARLDCNGLETGMYLPAGIFDSQTNRWFFVINNTGDYVKGTWVNPTVRSRIVSVGTLANATANADKIKNEFQMPTLNIQAFTMRQENNRTIFYGCMSDNRLYRMDPLTNLSTQIAFPAASISCHPATKIRFEDNWLIFSYSKNALIGVAAKEILPQ